MIIHPIEPCFDENSRILILGSFPSVKSRETGFFYGHPQNRFWRVLAALAGEDVPATVAEKRAFLLRNRIAVWDVCGSCDIDGSSDASLRNASPNDLSRVLGSCGICAVFTNGKTADRLYDLFFGDQISLPKICLPSTSPANASFGLEKLVNAWGVVFEFL